MQIGFQVIEFAIGICATTLAFEVARAGGMFRDIPIVLAADAST